MRFTVFSLATVLAFASPVSAQVIIKDNSNPVVVDGITEYQTDFNMVGGMKVSWTLTGGSYSGTWGSLNGVSANGVNAPSTAWGIWTTDFKLWGTGSSDTFGNNAWNLWARNLKSFTLEALFGDGVFDVKSCDNTPCSTPDSESGKEFNWDDDVDSRVTYSNPVAVSPALPGAFVGDLYGTLKVEFGEYDYSCPSGYSLYNGQCKKLVGYVCPSGWTLYSTDNCKKLYNNRWYYDDADKVYDYQTPTKVWDDKVFGTSSKCNGSKSPTYEGWVNWSYIDNDRCFDRFSQDMDNTFLDDPGTNQEVVPEPATMTLLATGLAGMAASRRRKQAAK